MILSILYYLLFSALFYGVYRLSYARLSFHKFNRAAVLLLPLTALAIALLAPRFSLPSSSGQLLVLQLPEVIIEGEALQMEQLKSGTLPSTWTIIYLLGIAISLAYFAFGLWRLRNLIRESKVDNQNGKYRILWSKHIEGAFCFGRFIFLPESLRAHPDLDLVIEHEKSHIQMGHVWDRLYFRALSTLLWFDPFVHAFARELRQIHEYEVDANILQNQEIENYAHTLLRSTLGADLNFPEKALAPSPFFNSSLIKSRISMMYANQSRPWRKALYAFLIPLTLGMTVFACNKADESQADTETEQKEEQKAVDINEIEVLPLSNLCTEDANAEERKACLFQAVSKHIGDNFKYPELAEAEGMEGKILVSFVIKTDGSIGNVEVLRNSLNDETDTEKTAKEQAEVQAISLISSMPSFSSPAIKDGKPVNLKLVIPIKLQLS